MGSRAHAGDEANGSFSPAEPSLQEARSGVESAAPKGEVAQNEYRRAPSDEKYLDRTALAERMRTREE